MKWALAALAILIVCALLLPLPRKAAGHLEGLAYAGGDAQACTIDADMTRLTYLLRTNELRGALALSTDARTQGATFTAPESGHFKGYSGEYFLLTGYTADGTPFCAGLIIAPADLSWVYVQNWLEDGTSCELIAPAATDEEAQAIRDRAREYCGVIPG